MERDSYATLAGDLEAHILSVSKNTEGNRKRPIFWANPDFQKIILDICDQTGFVSSKLEYFQTENLKEFWAQMASFIKALVDREVTWREQ